MLPSLKTALFSLAVILTSSTLGKTAEEEGLTIQSKSRSSPRDLTTSEGVGSDGPTTYYSFNGYNGLKLPLTLPATPKFDYTIMFWFRSHLSAEELIYESDSKAYLFDFPECCSCYIENGKALKCTILTEDEDGEMVSSSYEMPSFSFFPDI